MRSDAAIAITALIVEVARESTALEVIETLQGRYQRDEA